MLTWIHLLPANVVLFGLAAMAATLYGIAALWAVGGRAGWLWRTAPVALLLAALVPIGAYELLAVFGAQVAIVIAWVLVVRFGRAFRHCHNHGESRRDALRTALRREWSERARFHLRDVLLAVLLAGVVLAIVRLAPPLRTGMGLLPPISGAYVAAGAVVGLLTVAVEWAIFGRAGWYFRVPVLVLVSATAGGMLHWALDVIDTAAVASSIAIVTLTGLTRITGWAPWRQRADREKRTRAWLRRLSQGVVCAAALASLAILVPAYRAMLPPQPRAAVAMPDPNGYDELVRLGQSLNWSMNSDQDNANSLVLVREALKLPSRVPLLNSPYFGTAKTDFGILRNLARALAAQAKLAERQGRQADAVDIYLDIVQAGDTASRGGLLLHELVGIAIRGIGLHGIEPLAGQLNAAELAMLRKRLERSAEKQQPFERFLERDEAFCSANYGWFYRLLMALDHSLVGPAYQAATTAMHRSEAHLRLILAEAAVRQYMLQHGAPPDSLAALVPEYLSAVPQDPYGDGPLVYRTTDDGYLLYSVGSNGTDDGGQRVSFTAATIEGKGDLFFNVPEKTVETTDAVEETNGE